MMPSPVNRATDQVKACPVLAEETGSRAVRAPGQKPPTTPPCCLGVGSVRLSLFSNTVQGRTWLISSFHHLSRCFRALHSSALHLLICD